MVTIKIHVKGADISAEASGGLTVGMAGATYKVEYDPSWDGLSKIVIFRAGLNQLVALDGLVPPGVLTAERTMLRVGVEGRNQDGRLIIPTIWTDVGYVLPSANTDGASNLDPANPAWAQSAAIAQQALDKAEHLERRADSGEFQGEPGPQGPGYTHSEEFTNLANQIHADMVTAENAAKLSGRNASYAVSASKEANQSAIAARAEADRAKQEADRAAQGGEGLTAQQQELMLTIFRAGVYNSDQSVNINRLEASFTGSVQPDPPAPVETWSVVNALTHCTNSNSAAAIAKGHPYNATLTADQGYTMEGADITILMGGNDITVQAYSFGTISIETVTSDLIITAAAKEVSSGNEEIDISSKMNIENKYYWGMNNGLHAEKMTLGCEPFALKPNARYRLTLIMWSDAVYLGGVVSGPGFSKPDCTFNGNKTALSKTPAGTLDGTDMSEYVFEFDTKPEAHYVVFGLIKDRLSECSLVEVK